MLNNFEHRKEPLASTGDFLNGCRALRALAAGIILVSLGIGILGYHYLEGLSWIDSLLNASMILGGMGPVAPLQTDGRQAVRLFLCIVLGDGLPGGGRCLDRADLPPLPAPFPS